MASPNKPALRMLMMGANPEIKNKTQLLDYINANITDLGIEGEDNDYGRGVTFMDKYPFLTTKKTPTKKRKEEEISKEEKVIEEKIEVKPKRKFWGIFKPKNC